MNNIPVITDKEKLYDKCENMEQLFDKYYLPLLDKHYSKVYQLQQENQELKKRLENCYCNRTDCSGRIKDSKTYDSLQQENEKLKKQLEINSKINIADHKYASECEDKVIVLENQQKEFIKYLTDYIDTLNQQEECVEGLDIVEEHILMVLEETLRKYHEIIGDMEND